MNKTEIKAARLKMGLGVGEMADALGVDRDTYSKWEREASPQRASAVAIAAIKMLVFINDHGLLQSWISKSARSPKCNT